MGYAELKKDGICVSCKIHKARPDRVLCEDCFLRQQENERKRRRKMRKHTLCHGCKNTIFKFDQSELIKKINNKEYTFCDNCISFCENNKCSLCYESSYIVKGFIRDCIFYKKGDEL